MEELLRVRFRARRTQLQVTCPRNPRFTSPAQVDKDWIPRGKGFSMYLRPLGISTHP